MPVKIVWEKDGPVFDISGAPDFAELRKAEDEFYHDPRSDVARKKIVDLTDADALNISPEETAILGAFHVGQSRSTPGIRFAIVAPDGRFEDELKVFVDTLRHGAWELEVFSDLQAARDWAELPRP